MQVEAIPFRQFTARKGRPRRHSARFCPKYPPTAWATVHRNWDILRQASLRSLQHFTFESKPVQISSIGRVAQNIWVWSWGKTSCGFSCIHQKKNCRIEISLSLASIDQPPIQKSKCFYLHIIRTVPIEANQILIRRNLTMGKYYIDKTVTAKKAQPPTVLLSTQIPSWQTGWRTPTLR